MKIIKKLVLSILFVLVFTFPVEAASITLNWSPNPKEESVTTYIFHYQFEANDVQIINIYVSDLVDQENPSYTMQIMTFGIYKFWLTAKNNIAESDPTDKIIIDFSKPSPPLDLNYTITNDSIAE